jgi:hypothetical protein
MPGPDRLVPSPQIRHRDVPDHSRVRLPVLQIAQSDGDRRRVGAPPGERADPTTLAHLILATLHEASAIILSAPDPGAERVRTGQAVANVINGLRAR